MFEAGLAGLEELWDFTGVTDDAEVAADDATEEDVNDDGTTDIVGGAGSVDPAVYCDSQTIN